MPIIPTVAKEAQNSGGKSWAGTRARVQRLRDGKLFGGWILRDVSGGISVAMTGHKLEVGDVCSIQSFGWHSRVTRGICILVTDEEVSFRLEGQEIVRASAFEPRVSRKNLMAMIRTADALIPAEVCDISPNGLSLACDRKIGKGETLLLNIRVGDDVLRISVIVANVRTEDEQTRLGVKITGMNTADYDTWQALFEKIA